MKPLYTDYLPNLTSDVSNFVYSSGKGTFGRFDSAACYGFLGSVSVEYSDGSMASIDLESQRVVFTRSSLLSKQATRLALTLTLDDISGNVSFDLSSLADGTYAFGFIFNLCNGFTNLRLYSLENVEDATNPSWDDCHAAIAVGSDIATDGTEQAVMYSSASNDGTYWVGEYSESIGLIESPSQTYSDNQAVRYTDLMI